MSLSAGLITINTTATYEIHIDVAYDNDSGVREVLRTFLSTDGVPTPLTNSEAFSYHRNTAAGDGSAHISYIDSFVATDSIRLWVNSLTGATTCDLLPVGTRAIVRRIS